MLYVYRVLLFIWKVWYMINVLLLLFIKHNNTCLPCYMCIHYTIHKKFTVVHEFNNASTVRFIVDNTVVTLSLCNRFYSK
jgi:hypothetical protein